VDHPAAKTNWNWRAFSRIGIAGLFVLTVFEFAMPRDARAAINLIQVKRDGNSCTNQSSIAVTINASGLGNLLAVGAITSNVEGMITGITDNASGGSNSYVSANAFAARTIAGVDIWYAKNSKAGASTITVNASSGGLFGVVVWELSGVDTIAPLHSTSTLNTQPASSSPVGATATTTIPAAAIVSLITAFNTITGIHAGNPFTNDYTVCNEGQAHLIATSSGAFSAQWDQSVAGEYGTNAVSFKPAPPGIQVSSRSDTLSEPRPSTTSNHTVVFTVNNAIYGSSMSGSSTLTLMLPNGFSIPVGMDCGDVDAATSVPFSFNYPACRATATAWGFSATGSVIMLVPPSGTGVYVPTSTQVTIKIGSNATVGQQGSHWITNPSSAGVYTISVGGTFGGSGNILVAIISGVDVSATIAESLSLSVSSISAGACTADDGATITAINTGATSVPFGTVSANTFYQGCQDLVVSTNAGNGYSLTLQQSSKMRTASGTPIPDTTCDGGTCTESTAAAWTDAAKNGLGHTCFNQSNHDCNSAYSNGVNFRQAADTSTGETAQTLMTSSTPATATGRVKYRLSVGSGQTAGTYTNLITYIITGTY
jgi:hypothetical protein